MAEEKKLCAQLYAPSEPDAAQKKRFDDFISSKYGENIELQWI